MSSKIVMHLITGLGIGGAEKQLLLTVRYLPPQFHSIVVCLKDETLLIERFKESGVKVINLKAEGLNFISGIFKLRKIIIDEKVDVVHTHLARADIVGWFATIGFNTPVISTRHNTYEPWEKNIFLKFFYRRAMLRMKHIIAVSSSARNYLIRWLNIPEEKVTIIHNGIEVSKLSEIASLSARNDNRIGVIARNVETKQSNLKEELGIKDGEFVIGCISRLDPVKGHKYLIQSVPLVLKEIPLVKFLIVGDGPERHGLENMVLKLGLKENVIFTGYREDIPELLSIMDIFVQPSLKEGFGVSILEAIAVGKPIVATKVNGIVELTEGRKVCILVPPGDSRELAREINRLLKDDDLRRQISNTDISSFDIRKNIKELETLYRRLLLPKTI